MTREEIIRRFKSLEVWKRGGERAPHKPLLVLYAIGILLRREDRLISYGQEIKDNLTALLKKFGPERQQYQPDQPFWRLQKDEVWEVTDADRIDEDISGNPSKKDMKRYDVSGGFLKEIVHEFQMDPNFAFKISQYMLDHFPASMHQEILQTVEIPTFVIEPQPSNPNFQSDVMNAYKEKCAVCGFRVRLENQPVALEVTYIKSPEAGGPDAEENGLALCSLHHELFNEGAFTLSENLHVLVSKHTKGKGTEDWLKKFHGEKMKFPPHQIYYPRIHFIDWHFRNRFRGPAREKI